MASPCLLSISTATEAGVDVNINFLISKKTAIKFKPQPQEGSEIKPCSLITRSHVTANLRGPFILARTKKNEAQNVLVITFLTQALDDAVGTCADTTAGTCVHAQSTVPSRGTDVHHTRRSKTHAELLWLSALGKGLGWGGGGVRVGRCHLLVVGGVLQSCVSAARVRQYVTAAYHNARPIYEPSHPFVVVYSYMPTPRPSTRSCCSGV